MGNTLVGWGESGCEETRGEGPAGLGVAAAEGVGVGLARVWNVEPRGLAADRRWRAGEGGAQG